MIWSFVLLLVILPLFWMLFSSAVERVSRDVVDTRLLEFADQVRGYWVSVRSSSPIIRDDTRRTDYNAGDGASLQGYAGGADLDWIWQVSVAGRIELKSELLALTKNQFPVRTELKKNQFILRNLNTSLGPMRIAERVVDEAVASNQSMNPGEERVHYVVGLRTGRYLGYVDDHADRLRSLAWLAVIPIALALLGLSAVIILATRRNLAYLTKALESYARGDSVRVEGQFPSELQGTVDRLNALVGQNHKILGRTRKYVSKIAHDINHPLAILKNALSRDGDKDLMLRQVEGMAGLVDRYSSLARAIGPDGQGNQTTYIAEVLTDVIAGFSILYRRTPLSFELQCEPGIVFPAPRHDLEAMISNLVSNAHKYGESQVRLSASLDEIGLTITVEDDGPGIPQAKRKSAVYWGNRLDEAPPGTGFGLSIVEDIADLYDGELDFGDSDLGGLKVTVHLPIQS